MAGNLFARHQGMFRDMLFFDQVRGVDSTGVLLVPNTKEEPIVTKSTGLPEALHWTNPNLFDHKVKLKRLGKVFMGHNRAATIGKVTDETAHPFEYEKIIGAHNGTLTHWADLVNSDNYEVDSQALLHNINDHGIAHTWANMNGAAAITWWNKEDGTLNLIRNDQRTLFIAVGEKDDTLFWASEPWMITVAASRNGVKLKRNGEKSPPIVTPLNPDHVHTYTVTSTGYKEVAYEKCEPRPFPVRRNVNVGKTNGVGIINPSVFHEKTNKKWSLHTSKGGKETRGLKFKLEGMRTFNRDWGTNPVNERYVYGRILEAPYTEIQVIPEDYKDYLELQGYINTGHVFETRTRVRIKEEMTVAIKKTIYRVLSANVDLVEEPEEDKVVELHPTKKYKAIGHFNQTEYLDRNEWLNLVKELTGSGCCLSCDDTLDPEDHEKIEWMGIQQIPFCPTCSKSDPWAIATPSHNSTRSIQ